MRLLGYRPLPLAVQLMHLRTLFSDGCGEIKGERLIWRQTIQPHVLAHQYKCRLEYAVGRYPEIYCVEPRLTDLADGRNVPHVYSRVEPVSMCLFMKRKECWTDGMLLGKVVIPLAHYWLAGFEDWLYSGQWRFGGTHEIVPEPPKDIPSFSKDA
jgi:hypothetical protein